VSIAEHQTDGGSERNAFRSIESFKQRAAPRSAPAAHPGILDQVQVDYYGAMVPIQPGRKNVSSWMRATIQRAALGKRHGREDRERRFASPTSPEPAAQGDLLARADAGS